MRVAIVGYGDLGRYMKTVLQEYEGVRDDDFVYFDDVYHAAGGQASYPFRQYADAAFADTAFYVCLGYKHLVVKDEVLAALIGLGRRVPPFVHHSAYVHPSVTLGPGSFVYPGCNFDRGTRIGRGSWFVNGVVIAHDCVVGDCCWFGPGVTLSGNVTIDAHTFIGSGSTVSNSVRVGAGATVGLATAVTHDVANGASVIGSPMRVLDHPLQLI